MTVERFAPVVPASDPPRILVADQDPLFGRILRARLEKWGYKAELEPSGAAAFALFKIESYRVVILDFDLPGIDGLELCRQIRKLHKPRYTYVIFYSTRGDKDSMLAALEAGADDFMPKPFNAIELGLRLKNAQRLLDLDDELYHGGGIDKVSGVINRQAFVQFFATTLAQYRRGKLDGTLMFVKILNLQDILRARGFHAAQRVVAALSPGLQMAKRASDILAKTSDDEFCLLLQDTVWDKCLPVADRILAFARDLAVSVEGIEIYPRVAISSANFPHGDLNADQHLTQAPRTPYLTQDAPQTGALPTAI